jgi:hypothetical protein
MSNDGERPKEGPVLSRRRVLRGGLTLGGIAAGLPATRLFAADADSASLRREDIRSSQSTVLEALTGKIEKIVLRRKAFPDSAEVIANLPEEFLARSFIFSDKANVKAVCRRAGYVYAVAQLDSLQARLLIAKGFGLLDFAAFQIFSDDSREASVFQKRVAEGEVLAFGPSVLLIFGPEEQGGVPYSKMQSLVPPAFLPDGSEFKTWEVAEKFSATLYVNQAHPNAADSNPGTKERPLKTINRAAQLLRPGERVIVSAGLYRECVHPLRGGTDPEHMITYQAEPGAKVVISGGEIVKTKWVQSEPWVQDNRTEVHKATVEQIWMAHLPSELFSGYNPFEVANFRHVDQESYWYSGLSALFADPKTHLFLQVCGLLFQNGKRLEQVTRYTDLFTKEGAYWVEPNGVKVHISTFGGVDPNQAEWEATAREQIFAPEAYHLGYIKVKGFTMEYAGNAFPFPHRGAISTMMGHHWVIEDNTVQWVNSVAVDIGDQGEPPSKRPDILGFHIVRGNRLNDIGICGVTGPGPINSLIEDNVFHRNAWHDIELLAECGAIKTHHNINVLMRRNLIFDTLHGTGIYIDSVNSNSRICQNVIVNTSTNNGPGPGEGAIYVENALAPVMVDHNFIWGSTPTNGIYSYQTTKLIVAHNMVGNCGAAAIWMLDMPGRGSVSGGNSVLNNIIVNNGWDIGFYKNRNISDYNLIGNSHLPKPFRLGLASEDGGLTASRKGSRYPEHLDLAAWRNRYGYDVHSLEANITAEFNADTLELLWSVYGETCEGEPIEGMEHDFWDRSTTGRPVVPGPFGDVPKKTTRIVVDPRRHG